MKYHPIDRAKKQEVEQKALDNYLEDVEEPTFQSVAKKSKFEFNMGLLDWIMVAILILLYITTSYKTSYYAIGYSEAVTAGMGVSWWVLNSFIIFNAALFSLMATPALIYFKILDGTSTFQKRKEATKIRRWFSGEAFRVLSLEWVTPRLPMVIVYGTIAWLVTLHWAGDPYAIVWGLLIFVEIGLAWYVGSNLSKYQSYREKILDLWKPKHEAWEERVENYWGDPKFYNHLRDELRYALKHVTRKTGRFSSEKPNYAIFTDPSQEATVDKIIRNEYRRWWVANREFADKALEWHEEEVDAEPEENELPTNEDGEFIPPDGEDWTVDKLRQHLRLRGVGVDYNEGDLLSDYANGRNARSAFRDGAKEF